MREPGAVKANQVAAAPGRFRPPLPERRDRYHNQFWECRPQRFGVQTRTLELARRKAFNYRVSRADKLQQRVGIPGQVQDNATLTRVQIHVQPTGVWVGPVARERPKPARRITLRWLDLDDFRAQIAQELRRVRPGDVPRQLDNAHSRQWQTRQAGVW